MPIGTVHFPFFQVKNHPGFGDLPIVREGQRPVIYSQLSEGHRSFLDKIAKERGYCHYKDAGKFHPSARRALEDMILAAKGDKITLATFATYRPYDQQVPYFFSNNPNNHKIIGKVWRPDANGEE